MFVFIMYSLNITFLEIMKFYFLRKQIIFPFLDALHKNATEPSLEKNCLNNTRFDDDISYDVSSSRTFELNIWFQSGFGSVVECSTWDSRVAGSNPPFIWPNFFSVFLSTKKSSVNENFQPTYKSVANSIFQSFSKLREMREKASKPRGFALTRGKSWLLLPSEGARPCQARTGVSMTRASGAANPSGSLESWPYSQ